MPSKKKGQPSEESNIGDLVREAEHNYINGVTTISKYVQKSMYETLNTIDAYLNSKHISGSTDSKGREKPFFNIVTAAVNIWYRSTHIKLEKIRVRPTKSKDIIDAFLANVHLHDWFRRENFGLFLSEWDRTEARYGSAVVKFVEKDGRLIPSIVPWQRLIIDAIDFDSNAKIEVLELTEAQLYKSKYDMKMVEALCDARKARETLDGHDKDTKSDFIKVYEVHGELPLSYLTNNDADDDNYVQQMHVISFVASKEAGKWDDFTLYSGREAKDPYMITHLIKEDGQSLSMGAVEHLFEAQWMMNHTIFSIKNQLDLASKVFFQSADGNLLNRNVIDNIENGDFLIHAPNMPVTQVNSTSHDITSLQSFGNQWKALSNEITGISESMLGNTAPSGTAWRQVETLLQQNQSLFELMRDNKVLDIQRMLRTYVLPYIKKKMDTSEEVSATLDMYDIDKIDSKYIKNESTRRVNDTIKKKLLNGEDVSQEQQATMMNETANSIQQSLNDSGNQRFFKTSEISDRTWKEQFKDLEWELEIDAKDEQANMDAVATMNTLLNFFVSKQGQPLTPDEKVIVSKILSMTGQINPLEIQAISGRLPTAQPPQPPQPAAAPAQVT